jgi:transposase
MMRITLSNQERQQLEEIFKTTPNRRLRTRCQAIPMASCGRRHRQMAEDLRISGRTLQRWLHAYQGRGLDGLTIHWVPGRKAKIPGNWAPEILGWITRGPVGCGLDRANWTYAGLATYLYQTKGLTVSATTMRTCCQRHGVRPYRPTSHSLKAEPGQQEQARQDLQALKKRLKRVKSSC